MEFIKLSKEQPDDEDEVIFISNLFFNGHELSFTDRFHVGFFDKEKQLFNSHVLDQPVIFKLHEVEYWLPISELEKFIPKSEHQTKATGGRGKIDDSPFVAKEEKYYFVSYCATHKKSGEVKYENTVTLDIVDFQKELIESNDTSDYYKYFTILNFKEISKELYYKLENEL